MAFLGAMTESAEPECGYGGTIWYSFTPSETAYVGVETATNSSHMALAVYTGNDVGGLAMVNCRGFTRIPPFLREVALEPDGEHPLETYAGFVAEAGETYHIQITANDMPSRLRDLGTLSIDYAQTGDANCSGDLSAIDALQVLRLNAGLSASPCAPNGDTNCDGAVNAVDALTILRVVLSLLEPPDRCDIPLT